MSKTSRIDHQFVLLSLAIGLIFPIHRVLTFLAVFQREYPEFPHQRIESCSLEINVPAAWCPSFIDLFTAVTFTDFCHLGFRLSRALAFAFTLRFGRLLVPTICSFVSVLSTVSTFTFES